MGWLRGLWPSASRREIPDTLWAATLEAYPFLAELPAAARDRLRTLACRFLADKQFQGANGFEVTDAVAVAIAAQAVRPVLNLGLDWYDDFVGIVIHPSEVLARRTVQDATGVVHHYNEVLSGEAMDGGPVMLAWSEVARAAEAAPRGTNLVIHEFVHKLDLRDGHANGCPPMPRADLRRQWQTAMTEAFERFREQVTIAERFGGEPPWLDAYGATDPGEFFAVASEAYFVNRSRFGAEFPGLVVPFDRFYGPIDA